MQKPKQNLDKFIQDGGIKGGQEQGLVAGEGLTTTASPLGETAGW